MSPISARICVPNLVAVRRSCRKMGGGVQTDGQTDRQADRQTDRQTDRHRVYRQMETAALYSRWCMLQGSTLAMCPLARMHFFRSSGQFGPQQFILCWPEGPVAFRSVANACTSFFLLTYRVSPCDGLTYKYFHPQSYSICVY